MGVVNKCNFTAWKSSLFINFVENIRLLATFRALAGLKRLRLEAVFEFRLRRRGERLKRLWRAARGAVRW